MAAPTPAMVTKKEDPILPLALEPAGFMEGEGVAPTGEEGAMTPTLEWLGGTTGAVGATPVPPVPVADGLGFSPAVPVGPGSEPDPLALGGAAAAVLDIARATTKEARITAEEENFIMK